MYISRIFKIYFLDRWLKHGTIHFKTGNRAAQLSQVLSINCYLLVEFFDFLNSRNAVLKV